MLRVSNVLTGVGLFVAGWSAWAAPERAVPDQYVLQLKPGVLPTEVIRLNVEKRLEIEAALGAKVLRLIPSSSILLVQKSQEGASLSALDSLQASPMVEIAEPNFIVSTQEVSIKRTPNDPDLPKLWGMRNEGQPDSSRQAGVSGVDIGAERAWDIETGSRDVVVAVIDTGIDYNHPDLKPNVWANLAELSGEKGVDDDKNGYVDDIQGYDFFNSDSDPMDDQGHGSHVAGIIGASGNDGVGIVGVNWNVQLMALKFLDAKGEGTTAAALEAIRYAMKMNAPIMNNSWGGISYSKIMHNLILEANRNNILFVAAAGNHSKNNDEKPYYPANYDSPNLIAVAAINNLGKLANFSGFGPKTVHLAAPGLYVYSSTPKGYEIFSGTSMATPHVSGVAALVLARHSALAPQELRARLIGTSAPHRYLKDKVIAQGIVNAFYALLDQPAPVDPNDPNHWTLWQPLSIATEHPYAVNTRLSWEIEVKGASALSLYFTQFDTETRFDHISFYDRRGMIVDEISGALGPHWSPVIPGDYVRIVFRSDFRNVGQGFEISKVGFR